MKPILLIGLGNPLMGDDGVGCFVVESLSGDPRLPADVEVVCAGTDLLRLASRMEGRSRVVVLDACLDGERTGAVTVSKDNELSRLAGGQKHAHHLSPAEAIRVLRALTPGLAGVGFSLLTIGIRSAAASPRLSRELSEEVPRILQRVIEELTLKPPPLPSSG